jgi:hypothetical protein
MAQIDRIDGLVGSIATKAPVRCATTANITLAAFQTIDGQVLADGDANLRVLVNAQTDNTENGIYDASSGTWQRSADFDGSRDVVKGTQVEVQSGTTNGGYFFMVSSSDPIVIGTSAITFTSSSSAANSATAAAASASAAATSATTATTQATTATTQATNAATSATNAATSASAAATSATSASGSATTATTQASNAATSATSAAASATAAAASAVTATTAYEVNVTAAASKATPVDADLIGLVDSAASNVLKKLTWANLKATVKAYFDTLYAAKGANFDITSLTGITGLIDISNAAAGQIKFPATQNASADANTLDDYEEGTWTPVFTFVTPGDLSVTSYITQVGAYVKIGRLVTIHFDVNTSAFTFTTASGSLNITGIPFTALNTAGLANSGAGTFRGITKVGYTNFASNISANTSVITIQASASGLANSLVVAADVPSGGTFVVISNITYNS